MRQYDGSLWQFGACHSGLDPESSETITGVWVPCLYGACHSGFDPESSEMITAVWVPCLVGLLFDWILAWASMTGVFGSMTHVIPDLIRNPVRQYPLVAAPFTYKQYVFTND